MAEKFEILGLTEVERALKDLPVKMQAQIYRALNRKAAKKYIVDNLRSVLDYSSKTEAGINIIGDRNDKTAVYAGVTNKSFWLRFADKGTAKRYTEKGAYRGQIIGKNQIEPAILGSVDEIIKYMNEEVGTEITNILEKRLKSVNRKLTKL